ncbi:hypothetical protein BT96DRAFT_1018965 [Gymnopus androsaceus JB14]|uniref:Uncharacterized protein n=1 Tax=Gymnopus androsaceus JB14 TaxID=1447944 RepID=A0A6A4HSI4_9AGAR|nr:hypothetical protein BT96DRAFT_1018965 [Gymnopus androsaceus JB14]
MSLSKFKLRSSLFPLQRLSDDLLLEIFTHCVNSDLFDLNINERYALLNISWVCTQWRQLAIGCSKLWSNYALSFTKEPHYCKLFDLFLQRLREHSLSLSVYAYAPVHSTVLAQLTQHSSRLQQLELELHIDKPSDDPCLLYLDFPALETLKIDIRSRVEAAERLAYITGLLACAPNVHTFKLHGSSCAIPQNSFLSKSIRNYLHVSISNDSLWIMTEELLPLLTVQIQSP